MNSDRFLFLDFDGVLHPTTDGSSLFSNAHLLEEVFSKHQCNIAISSASDFILILKRLNFDFAM